MDLGFMAIEGVYDYRGYVETWCRCWTLSSGQMVFGIYRWQLGVDVELCLPNECLRYIYASVIGVFMLHDGS
jgi:hypothetical protein